MNQELRDPALVLGDVSRKVVRLRAGRVVLRPKYVFTAADDRGIEEERVVVVEDGIIREVADATGFRARDEDEVIEAPDQTLLPGFIETHCHVTGEWPDDPHATHLEPFPETRVLRGLLDAWAVLGAGFTSLFSMGHGHFNHVAAIKSAIDVDGLPGPRIYHCGWALSQTAGHGHVRNWNYDLVRHLRPRSAFADGAVQLRTLVRENVGNGADFIKLFAGEGGFTAPAHISRRLDFSPDEIRAITDEAHRLGFRVAAHCMTLQHVQHALENGVDRIEHGPVVYEQEFVPMLRDFSASWCPTLSQLHWALVEREKRRLTDAMVQRIQEALEARCKMLQEAVDIGVVVGFGTDNRMRPKAGQNGIEFQLMTRFGLAPEAALRIATSSAARLVGLDDKLGSIENDKLSDLLLVDGNPVQDISRLADANAVRTVFRSEQQAVVAPPR